MKKVMLVLLCMAGITTMAQKGEKKGQRAMNDMTPEQMATLRTKEMTLNLDLNDAQQKQVQALNLKNAKSHKATMEKRKAMKENEETKKPTSDERYAMKNERLDKMIAVKTEMKEILSPEQYEKWEKMAMQKGKNRKGKHENKQKKDTRK